MTGRLGTGSSPPAPSLPHPRYRILREIAPGGTGKVFLAHDALLDRQVALKVFPPGILPPSALRLLKKRFPDLSRVHHPNLAGYLDCSLDAENGEAFLVTEYVAGRDFLTTAREVPFPIFYLLLADLCRALDCLHAQGLIHGNLGPSQILLAGDDSMTAHSPVPSGPLALKVTDWGLENVLRSRDEASRGRNPCIAPECRKGAPPDPRSDLYAVGALLFLSLTRDPPEAMAGESPLSWQRLRREPALPGMEIPGVLARITERLLRTAPSDRFQSPREVIEALNLEVKDPIPLETPETREGYLQSVPFVGRAAELSLLAKALRPMQSESEKEREGSGPRLILVSGEPGIGKTRLARELRNRTPSPGILFLEGECRDKGNVAFEAFLPILRQLIWKIQRETPAPASSPGADVSSVSARESRPRSEILRRWGPALARLLPEILQVDETPVLPPLETEQERFRIVDAIANLVLETSRAWPMVLHLSDLHWADELALDVLLILAKRRSSGRALLLGTYRPDEAAGRPLGKVLEGLHREKFFLEIALRPLTRLDLDELLKPLSRAWKLPKDFASALHMQTGGNPFFAQELVRTALETGSVPPADRDNSAGDQVLSIHSLPPTIRSVLQKRYAALDPDCHAILKPLAVFGAPLSRGHLLKFSGLDPYRFSASLHVLNTKGLVFEETAGEEPLFRFCHASAERTYYHSLPAGTVRALHAGIAAFLLEAKAEHLQPHLETLAHHFHKAGDRENALKYGRLAGEKSLALGAPSSALSHFHTALALASQKPPSIRFEIIEKMADCKKTMGHFQEAISLLRKGLKDLRPQPLSPQHAKGCELLGDLHRHTGDLARATQSARRSHDIYQKTADRRGMARALEILGKICWTSGKFSDALDFHFQALEIRKTLPFSAETGNSFLNIGLGYWSIGQLDNAKFYSRLAERVFGEEKNYYSRILVVNNLAILEKESGNLQKARAYLRHSKNLATASGVNYGVGLAFANLAEIEGFSGNLRRGLHYAALASELFRKIRQTHGILSTQEILSGIHLLAGSFAASRSIAARSLSAGEMLGHDGIQGASLLNLLRNLHETNSQEHLPQVIGRMVRLAQRTKYPPLRTLLLLGLADHFHSYGDSSKTNRFLKALAQTPSNERFFEHRCRYHLLLAKILIGRGKLGGAARISSRTKTDALRAGFRCFSYDASLLEASCFLREGKAGAAYSEAVALLPSLRQSGLRLHQIEANRIIGKALLQQSNPEAAAGYFDHAAALIEEIGYSLPDGPARRGFLSRDDFSEVLQTARASTARLPRTHRKSGFDADLPATSPSLLRIEEHTQVLESPGRAEGFLREVLFSTLQECGMTRGGIFPEPFLGIPSLHASVSSPWPSDRMKAIEGFALAEARKRRTPLHGTRQRSGPDFAVPMPRQPDGVSAEFLWVPLRDGERFLGAMFLERAHTGAGVGEEAIRSLETIARRIAFFLDLFHVAQALEGRNPARARQDSGPVENSPFVAEAQAMQPVLGLARSAMESDCNLLITGESGTGKEVLAKTIHASSRRANSRFLAIDLGAIPESLAEAELFGFRKGAFTGAVADRPGLFEEASGGTLFLDEISNSSLALQAKLLRAIQEGEIRRIGETRSTKVDIRIIAATNRDPEAEIREGRFREDLFYRLRVMEIHLPPLRDRKEDIVPLANRFLREFWRKPGPPPVLSARACRALALHRFPGNVRELRNLIERAVALHSIPLLDPDHLGLEEKAAADSGPSGRKGSGKCAEQEMVENALRECRGNKILAAKRIGWNRQKLYRRMQEYGIPLDFGRL